MEEIFEEIDRSLESLDLPFYQRLAELKSELLEVAKENKMPENEVYRLYLQYRDNL